jgi:hypothetical protein
MVSRFALFCFIAFPDGKPEATFPENALLTIAFPDGKPEATFPENAYKQPAIPARIVS